MDSSARKPLQSVLYVDDEPDIREVVEMAPSLVANLDVKTCGSGAEALQLLSQFKPDIVLLDVMMPGLDGRQLWRACELKAP